MSPRVNPITRPGLEEGSAAVCPTCGGPLTHHSDPMGYGVTVEQCERFPKCDYWKTLERRVRPELARRPYVVDEKKRVRRSPGLAPTKVPTKAPRDGTGRRPTKQASRLAILLTLPITAETAETPAQLAERCLLSPGFVKLCLTDLRTEGRAEYRVLRVPGKTGRPAHAWWRVR